MHLCKCNGVADLKYAPPHMCFNAKFGHSALKDVDINTAEPQNWGALGTRPLEVGAWLALRTIQAACVATSNSVVLRQRLYA